MTLPSTNRRIALARHPAGVPAHEDFRLESVPLAPPPPRHLLVRNRFLSFDPGVRGWMSEQGSYMAPLALGETVRGMSIGEVVASDLPEFPIGTTVRAMAGWEEISLLPGDALGLQPVVPASDIPLDYYMGALGPTGLTAWVGFEALGGVEAGNTVLISAAAGAVGSVAGQIAKLKGAHVIGLASGSKLETVTALGFDAAVDRNAVDLKAAIAAVAPNGIDFYFENVGGKVLEAVLPNMALHSRIAACGMVADYNDPAHSPGVKGLFDIVIKRITMKGFFTFDDMDLCVRGQTELETYVRDGRLKVISNIRDGIESAPQAFIDLMSGATTGKTLVRL